MSTSRMFLTLTWPKPGSRSSSQTCSSYSFSHLSIRHTHPSSCLRIKSLRAKLASAFSPIPCMQNASSISSTWKMHLKSGHFLCVHSCHHSTILSHYTITYAPTFFSWFCLCLLPSTSILNIAPSGPFVIGQMMPLKPSGDLQYDSELKSKF